VAISRFEANARGDLKKRTQAKAGGARLKKRTQTPTPSAQGAGFEKTNPIGTVLFGCWAISRFEANLEGRIEKTNPSRSGRGGVEKTKPISDRGFRRVRN